MSPEAPCSVAPLRTRPLAHRLYPGGFFSICRVEQEKEGGPGLLPLTTEPPALSTLLFTWGRRSGNSCCINERIKKGESEGEYTGCRGQPQEHALTRKSRHRKLHPHNPRIAET